MHAVQSHTTRKLVDSVPTTTVSLICTVRNEIQTIGPLIESILHQTRPPDEIVIADAASTDGTEDVIRSYIARGYPIRLVDGRGNISMGRNKAIAHAASEIIVSADAGLTLGDDWLEQLVRPIERGLCDVTGGASQPLPQSLFEAVTSEMLYPKADWVQRKATAGKWRWPTRNGLAFRRRDWEAVGGFPEYLDHNEDTIFAASLQARGMRLLFVPAAMVYFRPRSSIKSFYRQLYLYARGDGIAGTKNTVYAVRLVGGAMSAVTAIAMPRLPRRLQLLLLTLGLAWVAGQRYRLRRAFAGRPPRDQVRGLVLIPFVRAVAEYARLLGGTAGRVKRWRSGVQ